MLFSSVPGRVSSVPLQLYLRVLSALQPYGRTLITFFIPQDIKGKMTQLEEKGAYRDFGASFGERVSMFLIVRERELHYIRWKPDFMIDFIWKLSMAKKR